MPRGGSTASLGLGGSGGSSLADGGDARAAGRRAQADGLDGGLRRHAAVRRRQSTSTMMYSVVDIAGLNRVSARILANAAGAIAGMAKAAAPAARRGEAAGRRDDVRRDDALRHAARASGWRSSATRCWCSTRPAPAAQTMEALVRGGFLAGVLDVTTTELARRIRRRRASRPGPGGWRRPASRASRRSCRSARSTW